MTDTDTTTEAKTDRPVPPKAKAKKAAAAKPPTFDRLKSKKGLVRRVPVYLDGEVQEEYEAAKIELDLLNNPAVAARTPEANKSAAVARYDAAKAALAEVTVTIVLASPRVTTDDDPPRHLKGRQAYEWLMAQFPPSEEDNAKHREAHGVDAPYDADAFAPAIVAACAREPELTATQVDELFSEWTYNEVMAVFTAAMEVCNASSIGSLGKGFGTT